MHTLFVLQTHAYIASFHGFLKQCLIIKLLVEFDVVILIFDYM